MQAHHIGSRLKSTLLSAMALPIGVLAAWAWIVASGRSEVEAAPVSEKSIPVTVAAVVERSATSWRDFSGRIEAIERVEIRSRVAGPVVATHFREGSIVRKGDLLFTIDRAPYAAAVDRAQAQLVLAQERARFAGSEFARAAHLMDDGAIAQREFDAARNSEREADASVLAAKAALQTARLDLGYTEIRAPVAGRIGRIEVTLGNLVSGGPGGPLLATLVSIDPIYASFDADEDVISAVVTSGAATAMGKRRAVETIPVEMGIGHGSSTPFRGHIQLVDNEVNARSGTLRVRAVFENPGGDLVAGQFARVRVGDPQPRKLLFVNERAVGTDQNKRYVYVVKPDSRIEYREVALGAVVDHLCVVSAGLKPGERIILSGLQRVHPGALVAPETVSMDAQESPAGSGAKS